VKKLVGVKLNIGIYFVNLRLAIFTYLFNNNNQNGKAHFIRKLLNNKGFNTICVDYCDADFASGISF
jgi:hypothetical protein